ncbi:Tetraspanin/Peripherin [Phytophthora cactorum]|nr:Tetraspanin/Peripherin [Phytophthora cactorum]
MRPSRKFLRLLTLLSFAVAWRCSAWRCTPGRRAAFMLGFAGAGRDKSRLTAALLLRELPTCHGALRGLLRGLLLPGRTRVLGQAPLDGQCTGALRDSSCCATYSDAVDYLEAPRGGNWSHCVACMLLVIASMYCVVRIVTVPIVMRSMLSVMNVAFTLLGTGLFIFGLSVKVHDEMTSGQTIIFIVVGTLMVALSVLGIIGSRSKSRSLLLIQYIIGLGSCLVALLVCSVSAFSFSDHLASTYNAHTSSTLACDINLSGCTNCTDVASEMAPCEGVMQTNNGYWVSCNSTSSNGGSMGSDSGCIQGMTVLNAEADQGYDQNDVAQCGKCPEWSASDVQAYLRSTLHLLGLFAVVVCLFMIVGFGSALVLRRSLAGYQTDSI